MERLTSVARGVGVVVARLLLVVLIATLLSPMAEARVRKVQPTHSKRPEFTSIVVDAETGKVVSEQDADQPNYQIGRASWRGRV